jgi:hypothetical protein
VDAGLSGLHGIMLIVDWRHGASQIVNIVDFDIQWESNVMPNHLEIFVVKKVFDISPRAREEIVDTHDDCSVSKQALA